jgi:hypothetical protein
MAKPVRVQDRVLGDASEPVTTVHVDVRKRSREYESVAVPAVHATD